MRPSYLTVAYTTLLQLNYFARAAVTRYHRLSGLTNRNLFPHNFGGWCLRSRCQQGCFFWGLCPWLVVGCLLPMSSHGLSSVCVCFRIFSDKNTSHVGPPICSHFTLILSLKDLSPNIGTFWGTRALGLHI